jgi:hypothetical protein
LSVVVGIEVPRSAQTLARCVHWPVVNI